MTSDDSRNITTCLTRLSDGEASAVAELMPLVYDELRNLAAVHLSRERPDHTLQPTALVHEAYLKLVDQTQAHWKGRAHFFAVAAQAIRRILIDHARKHRAAKRRGGRPITLSVASEISDGSIVDFMALNDALERLSSQSERQARVVELRFFAGMTVEEVAQALGVSVATVKTDWRFSRAWLEEAMGDR